ncbi:melanoma antigen recognized by T-cells 1 [Perognathus longimembris pacificus]|uniref:melanoma antigen recognized by T-cells 1 n=1 Tax=Perognathus longimembris pacificus TaxID=214514 RepID=UPI002019BEAB|nr:melanoma antigen recognized by T-cells 1 [Perognathus longimembris pacificus]
MPRQDAYYSYPRKGHSRSHITTGEAAGIGILTVVLGILLLLGCWYCRRRSGYRTLTNKSPHAATESTSGEKYPHEVLGYENSGQSQEKNCDPLVPNAPPAYEKLPSDQSPPPYSP